MSASARIEAHHAMTRQPSLRASLLQSDGGERGAFAMTDDLTAMLLEDAERDRETVAEWDGTLPHDPTHPEYSCGRCGRRNVWSWHAPSPLWNAVMRDLKTGEDAYSVVCPPCFAELAEAHGLHYVWHFGPHEDVTGLWRDTGGRVWDPERCLWVESPSQPITGDQP